MRKRALFALGMCAAALVGEVSLTLANQAQGSVPQTSGQQSAPQQSPAQQSTAQTQQTEKQPSAPKARPAMSPETAKPASSPRTQAAPPSQHPDRPPYAQKSQPAPSSHETGKQAANQKAQATARPQAGKQASAQKLQATPPIPLTAKTASRPKAQAALNSPQTKQTAGVKAQAARRPAIPPGYRLLTLNEGRAIAQGIAWADDEEGLSPDCSHLVHKLYAQAGHPYPYASSLDLYRGTGPFLRVRYAHPGDLVVWRGHAGIVVNPREHSFFSTTSSGARLENYRSAYWRGRGYPHFFRYLTKSPLQHATSEASNRSPALQPASQPRASQPAASQRKDPPQD